MPQNYYKSNRIQKKLPRIEDEQYLLYVKQKNHYMKI